MFRQIINETPLTTDTANSFFQHISGESFQRDMSFLSTLRALVAPRMKEGESLNISFHQSSYSEQQLKGLSVQKAIQAVCDLSFLESGDIIIHNFRHDSQDSNYAWMELMKSSFESTHIGWHLIDKVTDFFRKTFYVLCFVNPDEKKVVVFVDNMDIRKMHYLQCSIFAFLPWYFDPKEGVCALEMELIKSLREKDSTMYKDCIAKIAEQYDFRTARIRHLLTGFETKFERMECENVRREIENYIDCINRLNRQIGDYLRTKADAEIKLLGLESKIAADPGDSEIMEYFLCNDKLVLEEVTDSYIVFSVKTYLEYYDEDIAKSIIDRSTSYIYRPSEDDCSEYIPAEDMKKLMYAIFIDQTIRIRLCAAYRFELRGNVDALRNHAFGAEFREYTPNVHIDRYSCLGNYERAITELLKKHDYISAIEQCVASCKSLNFADSPVMSEFMRRIYGISDYSVNNRFIELPDGKIVTPKEAIEWIKAQEAEVNE